MNSVFIGMLAALSGLFTDQPAIPPIASAPAPTFSITLGTRTACVTPSQSCQARADGGAIDVVAASGRLSTTLTGTVAANAHLCSTGTACEMFHLVQEFEITCSDSSVRSVSLTLESSLVGFLRSRHKAGAQMKVATAIVSPVNSVGRVLSVDHPFQVVEGADGRLCNQHLAPVTLPTMPLGRYVLTADFIIDSSASGLCDGHSVADFSPSTALPADWVRARDPFQGVDKKNFGYSLVLTAAADDSALARPGASARTSTPSVIKVSVAPRVRNAATAPRPIPVDAKGFDRLMRR
jgi:hypothetical protein